MKLLFCVIYYIYKNTLLHLSERQLMRGVGGKLYSAQNRIHLVELRLGYV